MVYIFNKYISPKKIIEIALTNIYGIGIHRARTVSNTLCINPKKRCCELTSIDISRICKVISANYKVGSFLQKDIHERVKKQIKLRSYKGLRHKYKLPVRGQRTHTNAKTRKRMTLF